MALVSQTWLHSVIVLWATSQISQPLASNENGVFKINSSTFLSPMFVLGPGSVANNFYNNIDFLKGHIAIKSFNAEVVDEAGNSVPLEEAFPHHWLVYRSYQRKGVEIDISKYVNDMSIQHSDVILVKNSGICDTVGRHYFGHSAESRKVDTYIPDPYGIEVGNPEQVPDGFEERWVLNAHVIDTRGVEDRFGCADCRCGLYNTTEDGSGPLPPDYRGGVRCCSNMSQCRLREGFKSTRRGLYLKYVVKWVYWDKSVVPVRIYIIDAAMEWRRANRSTGTPSKNICNTEYQIDPCDSHHRNDTDCINVKRPSFSFPSGGDVIYGYVTQHKGAIASALYGEDGRVICKSVPVYGKGNEAGYLVGTSTCYPQPGSVKIFDGEILTLESNYSSIEMHAGVIGIFSILVADPSPVTRGIKN